MRRQALLLALTLILSMLGLTTPATGHTGGGIMTGVIRVSTTGGGAYDLTASLTGSPGGELFVQGDVTGVAGLPPMCGAADGTNGSGVFGDHQLADMGFMWRGTTLLLTGSWSHGSAAGIFLAQLEAACAAPTDTAVVGPYQLF